MFLILVWMTGALALGMAIYAYRRTRDPFHPLIYLGPLLCYPYFISPLVLYQNGTVDRYLPMASMPFVQFVFLIGVASICIGVLAAGYPKQTSTFAWALSRGLRSRIHLAGVIFGFCGITAYFVTVVGMGGFYAVYGIAHGLLNYGNGYVRDAITLTVPGLLLIMMANTGRRMNFKDYILVAFFAFPIFFHGLVSTSRGSTFLIVSTLFFGWFMMRYRRPPMIYLLLGGAILATTILFLASHRDVIYLGSDFQYKEAAIENFVRKDTSGQEFIFGSGVVINVDRTDRFQWGALYFIRIFIRPIPRPLWPTQYEDTAKFFGIPTVSEGVWEHVATLGWSATGGASMGMVADMWLQFWWYMIIPLFLTGWVYGHVWKRAISNGGFWIVLYVILVSHSIFLTQQNIDSMLSKVLFIGVFGWLVWRLVVHKIWVRQKKRAVLEKSMFELQRKA